MDIKISEIRKATGGKVLGTLNENLPLAGISTDSRAIGKDDVFFALKGERFDGHDFLKEAHDKGARHFVISNVKKIPAEVKASNVIVVGDILTAYGDLAKFYRQKFRIPVIAVTGSSGKTTVKELLAHVLSQQFKALKNRGTENNLVGVPKTIFGLDASHQVAIFELGTNHPGEIERLASIAAPQIGIITMIGRAHLEGLKNIEGVKAEKLKLVAAVERGGLVILNGQDPNLADVKSGVHKILRAGFSKEGNDIVAEQMWCHDGGCTFRVDRQLREPNGEKELVETSLIGRHNALNCLYVLLAASALGMEFDAIRKAIATFKPVAGRLCLKNHAGIIFIDDSYNSNPGSFRAALDTLKEFKIRERKGVVCGDMLELGDQAEAMHREIGARIAELLFDFVIAAGPLSKCLVDEALKHGFDPKRIHHVKDSAEAGRLCRDIAAPGDMVLVKGSRAMAMEKVFECFITSSIR